jgi:hypothetical protein
VGIELLVKLDMVQIQEFTQPLHHLVHAATVAAVVAQDRLDHQALRAPQENRAVLAPRVNQANHPLPSAPLRLHLLASHVLVVSQDPRVNQAVLVSQVAMVSQGKLDRSQLLAHRDHQAHRAMTDSQDKQVLQDNQGPQPKASRAHQDHQALQAKQDHLVNRALQAKAVNLVDQEPLDPRAHQDPLETQETMADLVNQVAQDNQGKEERRASVPSTVLSMGVSSSRMGPDVEQQWI